MSAKTIHPSVGDWVLLGGDFCLPHEWWTAEVLWVAPDGAELLIQTCRTWG